MHYFIIQKIWSSFSSGQWKKILFLEVFFPWIYCCSSERKLALNLAINYWISSMNGGSISSHLPYFQWNIFIVAFSHLFLNFLLYKLDLCLTCDIWYNLNKVGLFFGCLILLCHYRFELNLISNLFSKPW